MSKLITSGQLGAIIKIILDWALGGKATQAQADRVIKALPDLLRNSKQEVERSTVLAPWIEQILKAENKAHQDFFGRTFDLTVFREFLRKTGKKQVATWKKRGREVHFLPDILFTRETEFPGWKAKPNEWFWKQLAAGKILVRNEKGELVVVREARLPGKVVLIDTRLKPAYRDGKQMYENDDLGGLIEGLRERGKLAKYGSSPQSSRFGVSPNEWENHLKQVVSEDLGIPHRLEMAIEANVISQLYPLMPRRDDGTTNTWEWREEFFGGASGRIGGGGSGSGGLASVGWRSSDDRWSYGAVRPLGVVS